MATFLRVNLEKYFEGEEKKFRLKSVYVWVSQRKLLEFFIFCVSKAYL